MEDESLPTTLKTRRENAIIVDGQLAEDELFDSPSYAAMIVIDRSANGLTSWRTEGGETLKKMETGDEGAGENETQSEG